MIVVLYVGLRRQKKRETLMSSKEDIRDNVIHYDDEGGGEEDTHAFDMGTLRNTKAIKEKMLRWGTGSEVTAQTEINESTPTTEGSADIIRDYIHQRLQENHLGFSAPPYDSLVTYAYEGDGSVGESLSSIESWMADGGEDFKYLSEWGPPFKTVAGILDKADPPVAAVEGSRE